LHWVLRRQLDVRRT